jgi:hypothetical protein
MPSSEKWVIARRSPWRILSAHSQTSNDHAAASLDSRLEALCKANASLLRPDREGRKVFTTLDQAWLQQPVCCTHPLYVVRTQFPSNFIEQMVQILSGLRQLKSAFIDTYTL